MAKLTDTFRTPEARVQKAIVAVDLTDSTKMKEEKPESDWLNTYAWFFDRLSDTITKKGGRIVKYLGDGLMAVFDEDDVANAINWAIEVQEEMALARAKNVVSCNATIGVGFGEVVEFDSGMGEKDYIGSVVDRAFRLCGAANANAVFVDTNTVAAASMTKITSKAGGSVARKRTSTEYQGPVELIRLKGFSIPVSYHEILWENARFSVKPQLATELSNRPTTPLHTPPTKWQLDQASKYVENPGWVKGSVTKVGSIFGFIAGMDNEQFYYKNDYLFDQRHILTEGSPVWFIPKDPIGAANNRQATEILLFRQNINGSLQYISENGFGFAVCVAQSGNSYKIFVNLGNANNLVIDDVIAFKVGENKKGFAGSNPKKQ